MKTCDISIKFVGDSEYRVLEKTEYSKIMYSVVANSESEALNLFKKRSSKVRFIGSLTYNF